MTSFRVIVAVVTSSAVTVSVAGPLAYQAVAARDVTAVASAVTTTNVAASNAPVRARARVRGVLVYADSADTPELLDGTRVTGKMCVFAHLDGATAVAWFLDDPSGVGPAVSSDVAPALQLYPGSSPTAFDSTQLKVGQHTLLARIWLSSGSTTDRVATFEVAAGK